MAHFAPKTCKQVYCCQACRLKDHQEKSGFNTVIGPLIPSGTAGAISELAVCVDLMRKGIPVFRAMSPSCCCDLIAIVNQKPMRVEVTKGWTNKNGALKCCPHDPENYDILALIMGNNAIIYIPDPFDLSLDVKGRK